MKPQFKLQRWISSTFLGLALAGSANLCQAAPALTNDFNTDITGWGVGFGTGTVSWNATAGPDGSGALMFVLDGSSATNHEVGPRITFATAVGTTINSADYVSIEYDLMIDSGSGLDENGSYGNWQEALSNASWSWDSHWVGALGASYTTYAHLSFAIPNNATIYPYLTFALQGTTNYSGSVTGYIDNLVINPFINPLVAGTFTNVDETANWSYGGRATTSFSSLEATGATPPGSLQVDVAYDDTTPGGWQEGTVNYSLGFAPPRYTYAAFDLYIENPNNVTTFGIVNLFLNTGGWTSVGTVNVNTNMVGTWTHVQMPLPSAASASQLIFQFGSTSTTNALRYFIDNVQVFKPNVPPSISIEKAGVPGVQIALNDANQWQREAIVTPAGAANVMWNTGLTNVVSYSFTLADFPDPIAHEGFEAHLYIVNGDTTSTGDQTYGGVDWNAYDIAIVSISSQTNNGGQYFAQFQFKTNLNNANPPEDAIHRPASLTTPTVLGTWALTFTDLTNVTLSGPGGISTNFLIPIEAVYNHFSPATSFLQFGVHKNDNENDGHNNGTKATFSRIQKVGGDFEFDETFNGPTYTNNYEWRKTLNSAVTHVPPGTAWWLTWTLPADGYTVVSAGDVMGPYSDASVTNTYQSGATMVGAVPAAALPAGNAAFFRLSRPE